MQEMTPVPKVRRRKMSKQQPPRRRGKTRRARPGGMKSMALNNPYQNVPVKSNNQQFMPRTGFDFPGAVL